jgi:hypothetical protein
MDKIILVDDVKHLTFAYYSCANVVEKRFECNNINNLIWCKPNKFGTNYKYCSNCYEQWDDYVNKVGKKNARTNGQLPLGNCLIKIKKRE